MIPFGLFRIPEGATQIYAVSRKKNTFFFKHGSFSDNSPFRRISCQLPIGSNNSVTGGSRRIGIYLHTHTNSAGRSWTTNKTGYLPICRNFPFRNLADKLIYLCLESHKNIVSQGVIGLTQLKGYIALLKQLPAQALLQ